jgi:hypothetical protein
MKTNELHPSGKCANCGKTSPYLFCDKDCLLHYERRGNKPMPHVEKSGEFNGPGIGPKEQMILLLRKAAKALVCTPPHVETAKKCIHGVIVLMEKNEIIDPDFEWLAQRQKQKEVETSQAHVREDIGSEDAPSPERQKDQDLLKELGW